MNHSIWIGYEPREAEAFAVARQSLRKHAPGVPIHAVVLQELRDAGLYQRPTSTRDGRLWDDISEAPMSTEFAISRFFVPKIAGTQWAVFMDCDFLALSNLSGLLGKLNPTKAVMCVQHKHAPTNKTKMDGQIQTQYARKNWTSMSVWNTRHPGIERLTSEMINTLPGRDLHRLCWLYDYEIGALPVEWNYLVGHSKMPEGKRPKLVHYTDGIPSMAGYEACEYADEWRAERAEWFAQEVYVRGRPSTWQRPAYTNGATR